MRLLVNNIEAKITEFLKVQNYDSVWSRILPGVDPGMISRRGGIKDSNILNTNNTFASVVGFLIET